MTLRRQNGLELRGAREVEIKPLIGLGGVLLAAITSEINDQVPNIALADIRGAMGISYDPGTWIQSLYISGETIGMAISPWIVPALTLRRWSVFGIALCAITSVLVPLSPNLEALYVLRCLQGFSGGLLIPLLMTAAVRILTPDIRLYGLAIYALTATFTPALATTLAALWTDLVNWRFIFFEAVPLCALAAACAWYGLPQDEPNYRPLELLDWRGLLLLVIGTGALSTMLFQGDRMDWFNSKFISILALISAVSIPLLLLNEWFHPWPLFRLQMLGRRNLAYGGIALFTFIIVSQASTTVPLQFLQQVAGYRPLQAHLVTLEIAASQLVLLPAMSPLLNRPQVDSRWVTLVGLALMLASCIGSAFLTPYWNRDQFYFWQAFQAVGQPMVIMSLLLMATNSVPDPSDGPFASALVNTPRALAEATGIWLFQLIGRWRGALHSNRIVDQVGLERWQVIQGNGVLPHNLPPLLPDGRPRVPNALEMLSRAVHQQVATLTTSDTFLILGGLILCLMAVVLVLPRRSLPPRIELAQH